jgi:hypothetical protein
VADVNKVKLIKAQGVKEIEIRATMFEATASYQRRKTQALGTLGAAAKHLKALLGKENDVTNDALKILLSLKVDRRLKGIPLGEKRIEQLAADLLDNQEGHDDFTIITKSGQRISREEIYMRITVPIKGVGKSVDREAAWKELRSFYLSLEKAGALEQ